LEAQKRAVDANEPDTRAAETKKKTLDRFVEDYARKRFKKKAQELLASVRQTLEVMCVTFKKNDPLLKSHGDDVIYFLLFREQRMYPDLPKI
jgi:hypothetical protein